jgi:menaquinone-dependent protoporphyrinogen IX oxidase
MKGVIIYKGKYGATEQYARMLAETTGFLLARPEDLSDDELDNYDCVVLGSSVYIGKLQLKQWMDNHSGLLRKKKLFIFIVCGTKSDDKAQTCQILKDNIPAELKLAVRVFFMRGKMNKNKLSFKDRLLLHMGAFFTKNPIDKKNMLTDYDEVSPSNLFPLVQSIAEATAVPLPANKPGLKVAG